jgi:hypothetical protein
LVLKEFFNSESCELASRAKCSNLYILLTNEAAKLNPKLKPKAAAEAVAATASTAAAVDSANFCIDINDPAKVMFEFNESDGTVLLANKRQVKGDYTLRQPQRVSPRVTLPPTWVTATPGIPPTCATATWYLKLEDQQNSSFYVGVAATSATNANAHKDNWYFTDFGMFANDNEVTATKFARQFFKSDDVVIVNLTRNGSNVTLTVINRNTNEKRALNFMCNDSLTPMVGVASEGQSYEIISAVVPDDEELDPAGFFKPVQPIKHETWWEKFLSGFKKGGGKSKITRKRLKKKGGNVTRHRKFKRTTNRSRKIHRKP